MSKISVIVPVYNVEKYIFQCVDSILNQTYRNIEIIIVDDGSTDKSSKICDEYQLKDSRVRVIHQKNKGLGGARNTGLKFATGEYVLFLDSDDWLECDALEIMINKIQNSRADIVIGGINLYIEETQEIKNGWIKDFSDRTGVYSINNDNFIETFTPAWARLYRKSFLDNNNLKFVEHCYYEDNSWGCFIAIYTKKIAFVKKVFFYRQHKNSITAIKDEKVFDWIKDFKYFYNFIKNQNINNEKLEMAKLWYFLNFYYYYKLLSHKNKKIFRKKIREILPLLNIDFKTIKETKVIKSTQEKEYLVSFLKFLNSIFMYKYFYEYKSLIYKIFSIKNDYKHKVITIFGIKFKFKSKKLLKRIGSDENSFMEDIFSIKNRNIHKVITILGIKFKFKSKKLIEQKRWQELQNSINQLHEQTERYNEAVASLDNKLNLLQTNMQSQLLTAFDSRQMKFNILKEEYNLVIREGTSDLSVFYQVFVDDNYKYSYAKDPQIILDIGANVGYTSIYYAKLFPKSKIYCLESDPENYKILLKNIEKYPNITPCNGALYSRDTILSIYDPNLGEWGLQVSETENNTNKKVQAYSFNSLLKLWELENTIIDVLKIDIEGSEKELFEGDVGFLNSVDLMIIETHDRFKSGTSQALFKVMQNKEFILNVKGEDLVFESKTYRSK